MKLTITVTAPDQDTLAETLELEVLRLVKEGYKEGSNRNDDGSYVFDIEGWDVADPAVAEWSERYGHRYDDDGQPSDLTEHSDFAQDDLPEHDGIGECW